MIFTFGFCCMVIGVVLLCRDDGPTALRTGAIMLYVGAGSCAISVVLFVGRWLP